jgi:hypothetical protein
MLESVVQAAGLAPLHVSGEQRQLPVRRLSVGPVQLGLNMLRSHLHQSGAGEMIVKFDVSFVDLSPLAA